MRPELCIIKVFDSPLHIITAWEFHHTCPIFEHVGVQNIPSLTHMVLHILPAASGGQSRYYNPVVRPSGWPWSPASSASSAEAAPSSPKTISVPIGTSSGEFYSDSVAIKVVAVSCMYSIFCISRVTKTWKFIKSFKLSQDPDIKN